jgi:biofilm PGA synthesis protein PgaA
VVTVACRHLLAIAASSILLVPASGLSTAREAVSGAQSTPSSSKELLTETRAARDRKEFARAEALARSGMQRFPHETVWPVLLALILSDENKTDEALKLLDTPAAARASETERLLARAYASRRANRPFDALRDYFAVLAKDPKNSEARGEAIVVLQSIRAPYAATALASEPPPLRLSADAAAAQVRWGTQDVPDDPRHRFDGTDRAIAAFDRLIPAAEASGDKDLAIRMRLDRMAALRDRGRMADVVAEANAVQSSGRRLPAYAREALADALLSLRHPEAARAEYEAVLKDDPGNRDAKIGKIYACVEMEDFAPAYAQADEMEKSEPMWRSFGNEGRYPNENHLDAALLAAALRFYGDQPRAAWKRIRPLRNGAPRNPYIRLGAASIMNARNWARASEAENRVALSLAPSLLPAQIAVAEAALGRNEIAEARARIAELAALYPENSQVKRLQKELEAQTSWQVEADVRPSNEKGGGSFGNSGNEINAYVRVLSPLIADQWRVFLDSNYSNAHPPEGFVDLQKNALGAQLIRPDYNASVAVTESFGSLTRTGATGTFDWIPSDAVHLAFAGERISSETPLRGLLHDITADSLSARFTYAWDEAHEASVGGSWLPFTDGNRRDTASVRYTQKVVAMPHFNVSVHGELYGSVNSLANVQPYYSPSGDGSATVGAEATHIIWRRYETSFTQALTLDGGWYGEREFKGGAIGTVNYEQRWRFDPWAEIAYGGYIGARMYDGAGSRVIGLFVTLRKKF